MTLSKLKSLKSFKVIKEFTGRFHADNHHELLEEIQVTLKNNNIDPSLLIESDYGFSLGTRTWMKPKIKKQSIGTITMRSKDYTYTDDFSGTTSYGDTIKAHQVSSSGFYTETYDGNRIIYTIIEGN